MWPGHPLPVVPWGAGGAVGRRGGRRGRTLLRAHRRAGRIRPRTRGLFGGDDQRIGTSLDPTRGAAIFGRARTRSHPASPRLSPYGRRPASRVSGGGSFAGALGRAG